MLVAAVLAVAVLVGGGDTSGVALAQQSVPERPTGLSVTSETHDSVTLSWDDPSDSSITGYQVLRRSRDGDTYEDGQGAAAFVVVHDDTGSATTTFTDTSVTAKTRYVYRVKARNAQGLSPRSSYANAETSVAPSITPVPTPQPTPVPTPQPTPVPTPQPAIPDTPTGLEVSSQTHDSVTLSWDDPADSSITGYQVLRRSRDGDTYEDGQGAAAFVVVHDDTGSATTTFTDTSVTAKTRYVYRVKARNAHGLSPRSSYANAETSEAPAVAAAAKPTGLTLSTVSDTSASFTWTDPADTSITGYKILRREGTSGDFSTLTEDTGSAATSYTDDTVAAETAYEYRVVALNAGGSSPESDSLSVTTPEETSFVIIQDLDPPPQEEQVIIPDQDPPVISLVSNTDERDSVISIHRHLNNQNRILAQGFVTGPNPPGYNLREVGIEYATNQVRGTQNPRVRLREHKGPTQNRPGDLVANLSLSGSFSGDVETFTAPSGTILKPNTRYWVTVGEGQTDEQRTPMHLTSSTRQASSAAGWTIDDATQWKVDRNSDTWNLRVVDGGSRHMMQIDVRGFALGLAEVTIVDKGTITVHESARAANRFPKSGTIGAAHEAHRYTVSLEANKFYMFKLLDSTLGDGTMRLFDSSGETAVMDNGSPVVGYRALNIHEFVGARMYYRPSTSGTFTVYVGSEGGTRTGTYYLYTADITITGSRSNERAGQENDIKTYGDGNLALDDFVRGQFEDYVSSGGIQNGGYTDCDYFQANLQAGTRYTLSIKTASVAGSHRQLRGDIVGGGRLIGIGHSLTDGTRSVSFTPERTARHYIRVCAASITQPPVDNPNATASWEIEIDD